MFKIFVEKKISFQSENEIIINTIRNSLQINLRSLRIFNVYYLQNLDLITWKKAIKTVFSQSNTDDIFFELEFDKKASLAIQSLPGQFDVRAESALQCIKIINPHANPQIKTAKLYLFDQPLFENDLLKLKNWLINPVETQEIDLNNNPFLTQPINNSHIAIINNFINFNKAELIAFQKEISLSLDDLICIQNYFANTIKRNPTETEMALLNAYWSDHCRHTTFNTTLEKITIADQFLKAQMKKDLQRFYQMSKKYRFQKPINLMNLATIMAKTLQEEQKLEDVEVSQEVNAAAFFVNIKVNEKKEKWLIQFKNETHNHPTEIEPFGGAATCLGGAIRDPLSGRSFVYQGVRVSGAGNPFEEVSKTIANKLPQRYLSQVAAAGFSSYGNQIGLATSLVHERVHPGYRAKRLEAGMVVGASLADNVKRQNPQLGDLVLLLGGKTGRDGIGGAAGSSKAHTHQSLQTAAAEVQKGNPIEERKLQRLFANPEFAKRIIRANDLGAGGIVTAFGEIAESITINLDAVPLKYQGLNGTEIALSESQERMAIVIASKDLPKMKNFCDQENVEVNCIAKITDLQKLIITWQNQTIVDLDRDFLDSNGASRKISQVVIEKQELLSEAINYDLPSETIACLKSPLVASQQGLQQLFDSSIGSAAVLAPYGGIFQLSPEQVSVQKLPVQNAITDNCTIATFGFDPHLAVASPYLAGRAAILEVVAKIVAAGGDFAKTKLSLQEFFPRLENNPKKWGQATAALLGAFHAQFYLELAAIGGKDSMSGSFKEIEVPPTLIAFGINCTTSQKIVSSELKKVGNYLYLFKIDYQKMSGAKSFFQKLTNIVNKKETVSAFAISQGGIFAALAQMAFGNNLGFEIKSEEHLFYSYYGSIIIETTKTIEAGIFLGKVSSEWIVNQQNLDKFACLQAWTQRYQKVFSVSGQWNSVKELVNYEQTNLNSKLDFSSLDSPKINVLIPIFPGTNCELDLAKRFTLLNANCHQLVFNNLTDQAIENSINNLVNAIEKTDIFVLAGGFSAGDEPDGSGKFIVSVLQNPLIKKAITRLKKRQRLILGICNGFQALIKSGLLPYGEITSLSEDSPTLVKNQNNLHISRYVNTQTSTTKGPWMHGFKLNAIHTVPISHGEGRFRISKSEYRKLIANRQIAFQYTDFQNKSSQSKLFNPNQSDYAIEGIISRDGLILGKMAHSERYEQSIAKNIYGNKDQNLFANALKWLQERKND